MKYIFPDKLAKVMGGISQRTQFEASMLSMVFILAGLIGFTIYIWFTSNSLVFKIMWSVNAAAGFVLIGSYLITAYQQYFSFMQFKGLYSDNNVRRSKEDGEEEKGL